MAGMEVASGAWRGDTKKSIQSNERWLFIWEK